MRIIDLSQPLGTGTAEWPGDAPFRLGWTLRRDRGDSVNAAEIALSVHLGTHADGPAHTGAGGAPIGEAPLERYIGAAVVVHAPGATALEPALVAGLDLARTPRVLFRTRAPGSDPLAFPRAFPAIAPALARRLVAAGALLVGTDAPSVDPAESTTLETHGILAAGGVAILENLRLDEAPAGEYVLVALPLRLTEADSSPVRAVLLQAGTLASRELPAGDAGASGNAGDATGDASAGGNARASGGQPPRV